MNTVKLLLPALLFALLLQPAITSAQNVAPILSATGNQQYCPGSPMNIVTAFNIVDPDDTSTSAIYVQISEGYVNGQDVLTLANNPQYTTTWDPVAAKLTIRGINGQQVSYSTLIAAVQNVMYSNNSANPAGGMRTFSITMGQANYLPSTGHYYQFVSSLNISWIAARNAAAASTYYGLQGYLATLMSAEEAQLCGEQATGTGWIGGSDAQQEGVWRWVTGPPAEVGTVFWNGLANGSSPNFAFWNNGEPNNAGDEDYAHITAPGVGIPGSWNDLPLNGGDGSYRPMGYIVEYGGMPGDPVLNLSASTAINVPAITSTTPGFNCGSGSVLLQASVTGGIAYWYAAATGGAPLSSGSSYTTPQLSATTTYYVSAYPQTCAAPRTLITATIRDVPSLTVTNPTITTCGSGTATLEATAPTGITIRWYDMATGGNLIGTGPSITSPGITANTTFYAEAVATNGCPSPTRTPVQVNIGAQPTITTSATVQTCGSNAAPLSATASAGIINWYTDATGGTPIATGNTLTLPSITADITYYAEADDNGCLSAARTPVNIIYQPLPEITITAQPSICEAGTTTLEVAATSGTITWYDAQTGGNILATGTTYTTLPLTATVTYYAEANDNGCTAAARTPVTATVNPQPTLTTAVTATGCEGSSINLAATPSAGIVNWYADGVGGTPLGTGNTFATPVLTSDTVFYAEADHDGCISAQREAVAVTVLPLPVVTDEVIYFCEGATVSLNAGITGVTYLWEAGQTSQSINVSSPGTYTVNVTNPSGCTATKTFTVYQYDKPVIEEIRVSSGRLEILLDNDELQNYKYSVNGEDFQEPNVFYNMTPGLKTVYVKEIHDCGLVFDYVVIDMVPRFITPNNDNYNDVLTIRDIIIYPNATMSVFDRYGKLVVFLNRQNNFWDGTLNNELLPATDYWYVLKLDDNTPEIKGHFALMR